MKKEIFNNPVRVSPLGSGFFGLKNWIRSTGNPPREQLTLGTEMNPVLGQGLGVFNVMASKTPGNIDAEQGVVIGSISMGYGHYRMAIAMASAVTRLGKIPYWLDLSSFGYTEGGRMIKNLEGLYSLGSRLSQQSEIFNRFFYEPFSARGFKKLDANLRDQHSAALYSPILRGLPRRIPFIATHSWPAQGALQAGMERVVNAVPDNWPLGMHLAEGALHTVQSPSAYFGYRTLRGMAGKKVLYPIPADEIFEVGHYVDHELLKNLESDTLKRLQRIEDRGPFRLLISIGGAGAQEGLIGEILKHLLPFLVAKKVVVFINVGYHRKVWEGFVKKEPRLRNLAREHFNTFDEVIALSREEAPVEGIRVFYHENPFAAVYTTNLLMPVSDLLITKPSELSYYPIPKLLIKRVGHHEAYGVIRSSELGDGTIECVDLPHIFQMLDLILEEKDLLKLMNHHILRAKGAGVYDGAYKTVALALGEEF
ncbi:MAG: hypothetical protein AVO33_00855 [delta proteobacterium ML8_F1]|nr:MAG: hypothetical protein AVO33_00855 [delta proteobacterium ML8_F1]